MLISGVRDIAGLSKERPEKDILQELRTDMFT